MKDSVANKKFSLVNIINIVLEEEKEEIDAHQKQKDTWQAIDLVKGNNQEKQNLIVFIILEDKINRCC